jgi:tRNA(fMet)-specific endonuclease VapC
MDYVSEVLVLRRLVSGATHISTLGWPPIRVQLELAGTPIGGDDLFIAAQAITLSLSLVPGNENDFLRIGGLRVES